MSDNEMLSATDITERGRKKVRLSTGKHVIVGRLSLAKFVEVMGNMPDVSQLKKLREQSDKQVLTAGRMNHMIKIIEDVVRAGVIEPQLFDDPRNGPTPRDLSQTDQQHIFAEILKITGATESAGGEVIPLSPTSA